MKFTGWRDNIIRWILNCFTQETNKDLKLFVVLGTACGFGKEINKRSKQRGKESVGLLRNLSRKLATGKVDNAA